MNNHTQKIAYLQDQIKSAKSASPLALRYGSGNSNTTRTKSYKNGSRKLDFGSLDEIVHIDPVKCVAVVEPRVTMEKLVQAVLPYGLTVPLVPEFKGITVGGAIMGGAAESSSHEWGTFNDICSAYEILCGNGDLLRVSPTENADIFYGIAGSYGSLGVLVSAEVRLIPASDYVFLRYHVFSDPQKAIQLIQSLSHAEAAPDYIDGIVFARDQAVVIEGHRKPTHSSLVSLEPAYSEWYFQHVKGIADGRLPQEETISLQDYLFRYDRGAFWMGAYLLRFPLLARIVAQGIFKIGKGKERFSEAEVRDFCKIHYPNTLLRTLTSPFMNSQRLWGLFHKAEKWVQDRNILQDFCIPEHRAEQFLEDALLDPGTFPLWLCPIKGTRHPQIFSPHLISEDNPTGRFINIGVYGLPSYYAPIEQITKKLEWKTWACGGKKVLYSNSCYTQDEFWEIYSREAYEALRTRTRANGIFHEITDKVLSR
jgi:hypothetical protein